MTVEVTRTGDGLRLARLDLFFVELLRQIPVSADPGDSDAARDRIYPPATTDPQADANEDWRAYVHPELKEFFTTASQLVREDLETFEQLDDTQRQLGVRDSRGALRSMAERPQPGAARAGGPVRVRGKGDEPERPRAPSRPCGT